MKIRLRLQKPTDRGSLTQDLAEKDLEMTAAPRVGEMFTFTTPDLGGLYASQDKSGPWHFRVQDIEYRLDTITREVYAVVPCSVVM